MVIWGRVSSSYWILMAGHDTNTWHLDIVFSFFVIISTNI